MNCKAMINNILQKILEPCVAYCEQPQFKHHLRTYVWKGAAAININGDGIIDELADDPRTKEKESVTGGELTDNYYEKLAKGIGGYNQGAGTFGKTSWLTLLTTQATQTSKAYKDQAKKDYNSRSKLEKALVARTAGMDYANGRFKYNLI